MYMFINNILVFIGQNVPTSFISKSSIHVSPWHSHSSIMSSMLAIKVCFRSLDLNERSKCLQISFSIFTPKDDILLFS